MIANYPQSPCYYPASPPAPNTPPLRPSYYMTRSVSSDRPYLVPYYPCQMVPVYYMPVSYLCNDKSMSYSRPVSSPGEYIPSDMDLSNGWEYPQGSDWSPHALEPGDLSPYTDWERQDEISSQDLSPRRSSPLSVRSLSDLEAQLEGAELDPSDAESPAEPAESYSLQAVVYDRSAVLKLKYLQSESDKTVREALEQVVSPCIQTLFSCTTTFSECADVIIHNDNFSIPALIAAFEDLIDEYSLDREQSPWFVFRVLIYVRYKKGKKFDSNLFSNAKLVYNHFVSQSHACLEARIRSECLSALEAEEPSLRLSESYQEFSEFLPDL